MEAQYQQLEDLVRARYASVAWTHKIQEKQAEIYDSRYSIMATINIVAATITSVGIISLLFTDQSWVKFASTISQLDIAPLLCRLLGVSVPGTMKQQINIAFKQSE